MAYFEKITGAEKLKGFVITILFVVMAVMFGFMTAKKGMMIPIFLVVLPIAGAYLTILFLNPRIGIKSFLCYCFFVTALSRYVPGVPYGLGMDGLLVLSFLAIFFGGFRKTDWSPVKNDLCALALIWFILNILELGNPYGGSPLGWFYGFRAAGLYWFLVTIVTFMLLRKKKDLDTFILIFIGISALGTLWGIRQFLFGVDPMEQRWLDAGAAKTHVLFGKLRVFSFYSDAGQFGASQAHVGLISVLLALGPFSWTKRIIFGGIGLLILYGMLISGTRGALFVVFAGVFIYLILTKEIKILIIGAIFGGGAFFILKFTSIGSGNAEIVRLRTALDPNDASFQERLKNQNILKEYLSSRPFGTGVGTIGTWGVKYNEHKFISQIPPDSLFVKVWAEYGIVGFLLWFGIQMYVLGKSSGIIWNIRDPVLKQKLMALTAGSAGILFASYGNEVQNQMPTSAIVYMSWVFVFMAPRWEIEEEVRLEKTKQEEETEEA
ncbi:O-antigen ligase family protein [Fulvivirgaceae bacterium BMA10]|uniref:O-antigen ligase family protein n=1 Tax=Splendidivirga corallicola TaxID=3051826 RepID=A0ABT8KIE4_9BACT|nr:O-antigen ligase family protein [Fulvivirgaceae bacterium BMA10]